MTREDWIWVAVRVFGIYLIVLAVTSVPGLLSSAWVAFAARDVPRMAMSVSSDDATTSALTTMGKAVFHSRLADCVSFLARTVLFAAVGLYLVRSGRLLFRWVRPPTWGDDAAEDASVASGGDDGAH